VRSNVWVFGVIGLTAVLLGCGSKPPGVTNGTGGGGAAGLGNSAGAAGTDPGGGHAATAGATGGSTDLFPGTDPDAGTEDLCRTSCEADECGYVPDGCGNTILCGSCTPPAVCGAVEHYKCGIPGSDGSGGTSGGGSCTPKTCDTLGVTCGQQGDGCGNVLDCGGCGDGLECVQGQCSATAGCQPLTCDDYPEPGRCGPVSDNCSGILNCPFPACANDEQCGAVTPGYCGVPSCVPVNCEEALAGKPSGYCGFVSNGCDGQLQGCATVCAQGESCGVVADGGAFVQVCTTGGGSGGGVCTPVDQNTACAGKCGVVSDGCSSTYTCPSCGSGQICGAQTPNVCGTLTCTPLTCPDFNASCGAINDGCGGFLDCGICPSGTTCAGGGVPFECGAPSCQPKSATVACADANANCGSQSDGCSGIVDCGTCPGSQTCGGGGVANQCGSSCTPQLCTGIGATCGPQGDGCGGQLDCGTCTGGKVCRGTPSTCVVDPTCTNFCTAQDSCPSGQETSVTGKVYAPNGTEALYNALVYVPNIADLAQLPAIASGAVCQRCEDEDLGEPLVTAVTGPDGSFTLKNVPAGVDFPLVVKMGNWRRVTMIPAVASCSSNALSVDDARLPRHRNDAAPELVQHVNIPKTALVTGKVDAIECVMRKLGVADSEFSAPTGNGRIHLYQGQGSGTTASKGAGTARGTTGSCSAGTCTSNANCTGGSTCRSGRCSGTCSTNANCGTGGVCGLFAVGTSDSALVTGSTLNAYDVAILDCEGSDYTRSAARQNTLNAFADAGGRVFASHYSYTYLDGVTSVDQNKAPTAFNTSAAYKFDDTAVWFGPYNDEGSTTTGIIDLTNSKGQAFDAWLAATNALHPVFGDGYINIIDPRGFVKSLVSGVTDRFVYTQANHIVPGYTAQSTPSGDINVDDSIQQYSFNTPVGAAPDAVCGRVLYSAFHVAGANLDTHNAVFPEECNTAPLTPQEKILEFMIFDLSSCLTPSPPPSCTPKSCIELGKNCGFVSDGCGGIQSCGSCTAPDTCGGGGTPSVCGSTCTQKTCASAGATCGIIGDGCGGTLNCGTCTSGSVCGGGGTPNVCGTPACTPRSCASIGATCGLIGDGCGGTLNCGTCSSGSVCGGGGPNKCGTSTCTPTGCGSAECGSVGDGCGAAVSCGTCPSGSVCGAGGPNKCGAVCTPQTCEDTHKNCGFIGDGCGGVLDCGQCSEGVVCGGGGVANVCGGSCTPTTCDAHNADCGTLSDGCGGVLHCGTCPSGQVCGAQTPNQCGSGTCTKTTCGVQCGLISDGCSGTLDCGPCNGCVPYQCTSHVDCGPIADGCGNLIDCGICVGGNTCGGGGTPSHCGGAIH
jgi:hypothetical protein